MGRITPGAGRRHTKAMKKMANRGVNSVVKGEGAKPIPGVGGTAGGRALLKPAGRSGVKTVRPPSGTGRVHGTTKSRKG